MIQLPKSLEHRLIEAVKAVEKELKMPYINTVEQYGIEQGIEKGIEKQREKTARNMVLQTELNDQTIAAITELSIQEVAQLRLKLKKQQTGSDLN